MELFYAHPDQISGSTITLDDFEAQHLLKTLRKKTGDAIDITDGKGRHYRGVISSVKPLSVEIESETLKEPANRKIALALSFIRPNRLEFVLEKCTELGVNSFYLFRSEHANYFSDNKERFEKMLRQAIKQSNRFYMPDLFLLPSIDKLIHLTKDYNNTVAAIDVNSPPIASFVPNGENSSIVYCVGPEGGFSDQEIRQFKENGFRDISLGSYRLRAETAAIAGISYLSLFHS